MKIITKLQRKKSLSDQKAGTVSRQCKPGTQVIFSVLDTHLTKQSGIIFSISSRITASPSWGVWQ